MTLTEIHIDTIGPGGAAVGRVDGRITFVPGLMPGERARVRITQAKRRWARAELVELLEPSPERVTAPCPYFAASTGSCGGCSWQHADQSLHAAWKQSMVEQQLRRIGKLETEVAATLSPSAPLGYRNKAVFEVDNGQLAFHQSRSHALVTVNDCLLLHQELRSLMPRLGPLNGVSGLTLRIGANTAEIMILIEGEVPAQAVDWPGSVIRLGRKGLEVLKGEDHFHEEVAGQRLRISADAFFQVNTAGAETLVELVREALGAGPNDHLADLYAGGGLFAATVGRDAGRVSAVESAPSAQTDLPINASDKADIEHCPVEDWSGTADLVVCDPPRRGLETRGVETVTGTGARRIAYVSCDPGTFARDARMLTNTGYILESVQPVDMFPQTAHVEVVGLFAR